MMLTVFLNSKKNLTLRLKVGSLTLTSALLVAACADDSSRILGPEPAGGPGGPGDTSVITVSEPVQPTRQVISASGIKSASWLLNAEFQSSDADSLSYVSFSSGTFPDADSVEIVNLRTGTARVGRVLDGGLDPVAIAASVGDSLSVVVLRATDVVFRLRHRVPDRRPPVVVRTRPVRSATAVPLNSWIIIVFSEPIDISTITPERLRLLRDGQPVPVEHSLTPDGLTATLEPIDPLLPQTVYTVEILDGILDLAGDRLELGESVPFTTEAGAPGADPTAITITPDSLTLGAGLSVQLTVHDSNGDPVPASELVWSVTDSSIAHVSALGLVSGVSEGTAEVVGTLGILVSTVVVNVLNSLNLVSVTAGDSHSCGLTFDGVAWCWGSNDFGQLGTSTVPIQSTSPTPVESESRYSVISAGGDHTCALSQTGELSCWGRNDFGQVGDGSLVSRTLPALVAATPVFTAVTAGQDHSCARTVGGVASCWGRNNFGQVGDGSQSDRLEPVIVSGGLVFSSLSAGVAHTCGTTLSGEHYCWGSNGSGQLSDSNVDPVSLTPNHRSDTYGGIVGFFENMAAVSAGKDHTCALQNDGTVWCGGTLVVDAIEAPDKNGVRTAFLTCRRGDTGASLPCRDLMFLMHPELNYTNVTAGHEHSCSLATTGTVYCWGRDEFGQRGDLSTSRWMYVDPDTEPVAGNLAFAAIDAGAFHTCGVTRIGETYCWGRNDRGQLGDGTTADQGVPRLVSF